MSPSVEMRNPRRRILLLSLLLAAAVVGLPLTSDAMGMSEAVSIGLFFVTMLLAIPLMRSAERVEATAGCASPAGRRYNRRMIVAAMFYAVTLIGAVWLSKVGTYPTPVYILIAVAPSFPVIAMIAAMGRLLVEEKDEYLRSRHIHHALVATGITLALASVWGFLEQFNVAPHVASYWVFPAWVLSYGLSHLWSAVRS